ncbi:MAG: hypothetical protein ACJ8FY_04125 [Gemmataceae bacterium]
MLQTPAVANVLSLPSLDELRRFVRMTLCEADHLDLKQTPLQEAQISRGGRPCGLFFQVRGPRLLANYAIWAGEENRILFYNSTGFRFAETRLSEAPDPRQLPFLKRQAG